MVNVSASFLLFFSWSKPFGTSLVALLQPLLADVILIASAEACEGAFVYTSLKCFVTSHETLSQCLDRFYWDGGSEIRLQAFKCDRNEKERWKGNAF